MAARAIPEGYHSVTPYLTVEGADRLIEFVEAAFGATETERITTSDGRIAHAEVRIGDSVVMMSEAGERCAPMPTALYLYVPDADAAYRRALAAGAVSLMEPADQFYGDRNAGVQDPTGNRWWIATRVEDVPPQELHRRAAAFEQQQRKC
jgi:uncharacterized glyoxalase superfamily protein PhnB